MRSLLYFLGMENTYSIYTDGGSRGNPGPAGAGVYIARLEDGKEQEVSKIIHFWEP